MLLEAVRCELWHKPFSRKQLTDDEVKYLLDESNRQTVSGLASNTLAENSVDIGVMNVLEMMSYIRQNETDNIRLNDSLLAFAQKMSEAGIDFVVVKGQTLGALYPHPAMRTPGDVDFFCPGMAYDEVRKRLQPLLGIELSASAPRKEVFFKLGECPYELHNRLLLLAYPGHRRLWNRSLAQSVAKNYRVEVAGTPIHTLDPMLNVVYTFAHLFIHFIKEGIGLRHLCDLAVLLHHYNSEIDGEALQTLLRRLGLLRAFSAFCYMLRDYLGLPEEDVPFALDPRWKRYSARLMDSVLYAGNFAKTVREDSHSKRGYKWVTFKMMARHCWQYFRLAPLECAFFVPNYIQTNLYDLTRGE